MEDKKPDIEWIRAYYRGELNKRERRRLERYAKEDPAWKAAIFDLSKEYEKGHAFSEFEALKRRLAADNRRSRRMPVAQWALIIAILFGCLTFLIWTPPFMERSNPDHETSWDPDTVHYNESYGGIQGETPLADQRYSLRPQGNSAWVKGIGMQSNWAGYQRRWPASDPSLGRYANVLPDSTEADVMQLRRQIDQSDEAFRHRFQTVLVKETGNFRPYHVADSTGVDWHASLEVRAIPADGWDSFLNYWQRSVVNLEMVDRRVEVSFNLDPGGRPINVLVGGASSYDEERRIREAIGDGPAWKRTADGLIRFQLQLPAGHRNKVVAENPQPDR